MTMLIALVSQGVHVRVLVYDKDGKTHYFRSAPRHNKYSLWDFIEIVKRTNI